MLKKILFLAAMLMVMVPAAAADEGGKWVVGLNFGLEDPSGLDTIYAYSWGYNDYNGQPGAQTKSFVTNPSDDNSWKLSFGYEAAEWKAWVSYFKFNNNATSIASHQGTDTSMVLYNTLTLPWVDVYHQEGFTLSDEAIARTGSRLSRLDLNAGRIFNLTEHSQFMFYGGLMYMNLDAKLEMLYTDRQNWNIHYGPGSTDQVMLRSNSKGWGLNLGFTGSTHFGKRVELTGGIELTMARLARTDEQTERINFTWYDVGTVTAWQAKQHDSTLLPIPSAFVELDFMVTKNVFIQVGYKYTGIKDALTYNLNVSLYPPGSGWGSDSKNFGLDGPYFGLRFKF